MGAMNHGKLKHRASLFRRLRRLLVVVLVLLWACGGSPAHPSTGQTDSAALAGDSTTGTDGLATDTDAAISDETPPDTKTANGPRLVITPPKILLGTATPGQPATGQLKICNDGDAPLHVWPSLSKGSPWPDAQWNPAPDWTIAAPSLAGSCDTGLLVNLTLTAGTKMPADQLAATVVLGSDDPTHLQLQVPVVVTELLVSQLQVVPAYFLDFGAIQPGAVAVKSIQLSSVGTVPLQISKVFITSDSADEPEFTLPTPTFPPATASPTTVTLEGSQEVKVAFQAHAMPSTQSSAVLHILSNDQNGPDWQLELFGGTKPPSPCAVQVSQLPLDFGLLAYDTQKALKLTYANVGGQTCVLQSIKVLECGVVLGGPISPPSANCTTFTSAVFSTATPGADLIQLKPGQSAELAVTAKLASSPGLDAPKVANALLIATFANQGGGPLVHVPPINLTNPSTLATAKPNLIANFASPQLKLVQAPQPWTDATVGCAEPAQIVRVANVGTTPGQINQMVLLPLQPAFAVTPTVPVDGPLVVAPGAWVDVSVAFEPTATGDQYAQLLLFTNASGHCQPLAGGPPGAACNDNSQCPFGDFCAGTPITLPLAGSAGVSLQQTDTFLLADGHRVDLLLVLDASASMAAWHPGLVGSMAALVAALDQVPAAYHIGLVAMDGNLPGKLELSGGVRVVTPTTDDPVGHLIQLLTPAPGGSLASGYAAALAAVGPPMTLDSGQSCLASCDDPSLVCTPDPGAPTFSHCGGTNRGFMRKGVPLEVLFISDDDDPTAQTASQFLAALQQAKGGKATVRVHALAGDVPTGCSLGAKLANPSPHFSEAAKLAGGTVSSICQSDYGASLAGLVAQMTAGDLHFALRHAAVAQSLVVSVDGKPCSAGTWSYAEQAVTVPATSVCAPKAGQVLTVSYAKACL